MCDILISESHLKFLKYLIRSEIYFGSIKYLKLPGISHESHISKNPMTLHFNIFVCHIKVDSLK